MTDPRKQLAKPLYVEFDARGRIAKLYCKGCGVEIAKLTPNGFARNNKYAEIKMRFSDNSAHVTNICSDCVKIAQRSANFRQLLHDADMDQMEAEDPQMGKLGFRKRKQSKFEKAELKRRPLL